MFKRLLILAASMTVIAGSSAYAIDAQKLEFNPIGGGTFIYSNNPEGVDCHTLIDSDTPRYIMNNENLGPGKYYLYISHYNVTAHSWPSEAISDDMELDVELMPTSGECSYTISNTGFETATPVAWSENGYKRVTTPEWGLFNCCAEAMGKTLIEMDGSWVYDKLDNEKPQSVNTSERNWLSRYLPNYSVVHYREPVHIQAVLEITSGTMDVNVCAFKAGDILGDRSSFKEGAEYGIMRYERTQKGTSPTLPEVCADLSYTVDDTVSDGDFLPVTLYNHFAQGGVTLNEWYTNLNNLEDPWAKEKADETGMLAISYKDDSKLSYYGKDVPEEERDNIWVFDTHHSDTQSYEGQPGTSGADTYSPNYLVDDIVSGYGANLGNYGVTYTYNLLITNNGENMRYFTYAPTTASKIIVYTNENGKESEYGLVKKGYDEAKQEVMSVVELPPGETTEFSVNVILPVNYNGGTRNAFIIRDSAEKFDYERLISDIPEKNLVKPISGKYMSEYLKIKNNIPEETLSEFQGKADCYEVIDCGRYYAVRWCEWDGTPYSFSTSWSQCSNVYILDRDFNIISRKSFDSLPVLMAYNADENSEGALYVKTADGAIYETVNGIDWNRSALTGVPQNQTPINIRSTETNVEGNLSDIVKVSDWAADEVNEAYVKGLVPELLYENDSKDFSEKITRGEFCAAAVRLIIRDGKISIPAGTDLDFDDGNTFSDSLKDSIYALAELGVIYGYDDGCFHEDYAITREEAATILARLIELYGLNGETEISYSDGDLIQDWARLGVEKMTYYDIMHGVDDTRFEPQGTYTVEQSILTLLRVLNEI